MPIGLYPSTLLKRCLAWIVGFDFVWRILHATIIRVALYANHARRLREEQREESSFHRIILAISPDLTVRNGPFRGMRYPGLTSHGSRLAPKLIGCYEAELHGIIEEICSTYYTEIVDVGCAEGYYAVGLALRIPRARIFAYDTSEDAARLCRRMADRNVIGDRMVVGASCSPGELLKLPLTKRALVLCDCEGYEKELFGMETVAFLSRHDVLVEVHDFLDLGISRHLRQVFGSSHDLTVIESLDDIRKVQTYDYPELHGYDLSLRRKLLAEERPGAMEWFFFRSTGKSP